VSNHTITDTADRLRATDRLLVGDRWLLVEEVTDAQTLAHPGRLAVLLSDPNGRTFHNDLDLTIHVYAGETVTFRPGSTHLMGATGLRPGGVQLADWHAEVPR
jgi:hypothetical protein